MLATSFCFVNGYSLNNKDPEYESASYSEYVSCVHNSPVLQLRQMTVSSSGSELDIVDLDHSDQMVRRVRNQQ